MGGGSRRICEQRTPSSKALSGELGRLSEEQSKGAAESKGKGREG